LGSIEQKQYNQNVLTLHMQELLISMMNISYQRRQLQTLTTGWMIPLGLMVHQQKY
jgi:hypothetical protein